MPAEYSTRPYQDLALLLRPRVRFPSGKEGGVRVFASALHAGPAAEIRMNHVPERIKLGRAYQLISQISIHSANLQLSKWAKMEGCQPCCSKPVSRGTSSVARQI